MLSHGAFSAVRQLSYATASLQEWHTKRERRCRVHHTYRLLLSGVQSALDIQPDISLLIWLQILDLQMSLANDVSLPDHIIVIEFTRELLLIWHMNQALEVLIPDRMQSVLLDLCLELVLGSCVQAASAEAN